MPHCETCDRFYNPNTVRPDGRCPGCDAQLAEPLTRFETVSTPWHFKVLVAATIVYLAWRFVQLVVWAVT